MATTNPAPLLASRPWLVPIVAENGLDLDPVKNRDAWLAARRLGLGGSDVAAVVGEDPNRSAIDVFLERADPDQWGPPVSPVDENDGAIIMGRELEPVVLDLYGRGAPYWPRAGGVLAVLKPPSVMHRERPWQRGSVDGIAWDASAVDAVGASAHLGSLEMYTVEPDHGVEVKTHRWFAARARYERTDDGVPVDVPSEKRIQCAWYMALYKLPRWTLAALVDTSHRRTYVIPHDQQVEDYLLEEAERFWREHVLANTPPSADGSPSFARYLKQRFDRNRPELVTATDEINTLAGELWAERVAAKNIETHIESMKQRLQEFIGDAAGVETVHGRITWKYNERGTPDQGAIIERLAELLGMTDSELNVVRDAFRREPIRPFLTPRSWTK